MKLPSYEINHYQLDNAEEIHANYPESFWLPEKTKRQNLNIGDIVKLIFRMELIDDPEGISVERMWVQVIEVKDDYYIGTLDNDPAREVFLQYPDKVVFKSEHVINIYEDESK